MKFVPWLYDLRAFDLGLKFIEYQKLSSLRHYNFVALTTADDVLRLTALGVDLPLSEVYAGLDIPASED